MSPSLYYHVVDDLCEFLEAHVSPGECEVRVDVGFFLNEGIFPVADLEGREGSFPLPAVFH